MNEIVSEKHPSRIPERAKDITSNLLALGLAVFSADARRKLVFHGAEKAEKLGLLSHEDLLRAKADFKFHEKMRRVHSRKENGLSKYKYIFVEGTMIPYYAGSKIVVDPILFGLQGLNAFSDNELWIKSLLGLGIIGLHQGTSSIVRFTGTAFIGILTGVDLRAAALASAVPVAGFVLPYTAQAVVNSGSENRLLWHWAVRDTVGKLSRFSHLPGSLFHGGMGSKYEQNLHSWQVPFVKKTFGSLLEDLAVKKETPKN